MARKDSKGRNLRSGEYFDSKNNRYMFRKMVEGERVTITAKDLIELRIQENEILCRIDRGGNINNKASKILLNDYFDFWLETFAKSGRKATTCTNYKSYYDTHVRKTIGKKQITKITKVDCQGIINRMIENGLKHSTMSNLKSCLNIVFNCAMDDEIILKNPMMNIELPQTDSKQLEAIELEQVRLFMDYIKNNPRYSYTYSAFLALFNLGVRIGEMAALTWADIDFKDDTISINKTVNRYRKKDYGFTLGVASTKSKKSDRIVPMNSILRTEFMKHRIKSKVSAVSLPYVDDQGRQRGEVTDFIFLNYNGNAWSEPSFLALIKRIIEKYNREAEKENRTKLKDFCPHMARHTYTSLAYSAGADVKIVSQILGHASTKVTMDTYAHLTEEKMKEQKQVVKSIHIS